MSVEKQGNEPIFSTTGKVGVHYAPIGQTYGDLNTILEAIEENSRGTEVNIERNKFYQEIRRNKVLQDVVGDIIAHVGGSPACSFGEQALVLQIPSFPHLLRITTIDQLKRAILEGYHSGVVDTFSAVIQHKETPGARDIVISVTPQANIADVTLHHVLALCKKYPPETGRWVFTDAKVDNVGLLPDGTPIIIDLGAILPVPDTAAGEMTVARIQAFIDGAQEVNSGLIIPNFEWEMPNGTPKQHHFWGDPRDSKLANELRMIIQRLDDRLALKYLSNITSASKPLN